MELDRVPLWRGDHVAVAQLVEDFARYLYLPRLKDLSVLLDAISEGLALLTWVQDAFAFADSFDKNKSRYRGMRIGRIVSLDTDTPGLIVKPEFAQKQLEAERAQLPAGTPPTGTD